MRVFFALLMCTCFISFSYAQNSIQAINAKQLEKLMKIGVKIIDIRKEKQIQQTGIIPTSYRLSFYEKNNDKQRRLWLRQFVNIIDDKKIKFVLIAQNSKQAKLAAHILKDQRGYKQPLYLKGGIDTWINSERKMLMIK